MERRRLRFAMIGTGNFGPILAAFIGEVADVVAICDPNPDSRTRFVESTGLKVAEFAEYQSLLQTKDIDAVGADRSELYSHAHRGGRRASRKACFLRENDGSNCP